MSLNVTIRYKPDSFYAKDGLTSETLEHITEIHFNYDGKGKVAFESDIDCTGCTMDINDIAEFEAKIAQPAA